ncbi:MAG: ImmA/IrrE family metallo-endopeptidase [Candidatus Lokiarchaeota archaeon]|nr:ImmA/IrrE family metallo-endopeptidase [Candidatus Lokiarchaeota archaeon]
MSNSKDAFINPRMLKWAREESGFSLEEAAKSYMSPEKLERAERGEEKLTFKQFLTIANRYKRPPAFFYLERPPPEKFFKNDFRTIESERVKFTPILRDEIQKIKEKRLLAVRFQDYDREYDYSYISSITLNQNPESVANKILQVVNLDMVEREKWNNKYDAFNEWKQRFENIGILIFQISDIDINEMRGFSIPEIPYPSIILNRSDSVLGRIFTLIHEFCHLMLKKGGICTLKPEDEIHFEIERFCNAATGAALVPKNALFKIKGVKRVDVPKNWEETELNRLKRVFWVSKEVILRRFLTLQKTSREFYNEKRKEWQGLPKPTQAGGPAHYKKILTGYSRNYINIALNAMRNGKITLHDLSYYLDMNLKHLSKLEENL